MQRITQYTAYFLQCFDTVGLVIWPVKKPVPDMTYNVVGGTLSIALPTYIVQLSDNTKTTRSVARFLSSSRVSDEL